MSSLRSAAPDRAWRPMSKVPPSPAQARTVVLRPWTTLAALMPEAAPAAPLTAPVPRVDPLLEGDVPLHGATSDRSGSRGRISAPGRAGPIGRPLTPT